MHIVINVQSGNLESGAKTQYRIKSVSTQGTSSMLFIYKDVCINKMFGLEYKTFKQL